MYSCFFIFLSFSDAAFVRTAMGQTFCGSQYVMPNIHSGTRPLPPSVVLYTA